MPKTVICFAMVGQFLRPTSRRRAVSRHCRRADQNPLNEGTTRLSARAIAADTATAAARGAGAGKESGGGGMATANWQHLSVCRLLSVE